MAIADVAAFLNAGFTASDVEEVVEDLGYLLQNSTWPYSLERTTEMVTDSPDLLLEFLRAVSPSALNGAMIPRSVKAKVLRLR